MRRWSDLAVKLIAVWALLCAIVVWPQVREVEVGGRGGAIIDMDHPDEITYFESADLSAVRDSTGDVVIPIEKIAQIRGFRGEMLVTLRSGRTEIVQHGSFIDGRGYEHTSFVVRTTDAVQRDLESFSVSVMKGTVIVIGGRYGPRKVCRRDHRGSQLERLPSDYVYCPYHGVELLDAE
ncbi:MAG: hypothetical protein CMO43_03970 [Verrucomicrobiales bacterium]|nr:hypothetical protein [Verrucomicrobiales bacterium]